MIRQSRIVLLSAALVAISLACSHDPEWHLAMNLNPSDGHIMHYCEGWHTDSFIGDESNAFFKDYKNKYVWKEPANYIAIVRHHNGVADAVKVWRFKHWGLSLLQRFSDMNPGRRIETHGGDIQRTILPNAPNMLDDPIFSVDGDLAFNWGYGSNGARIALNGSYLSPRNKNDDNTHGLGNHFAIDPFSCKNPTIYPEWRHEASVIQDCPLSSCTKVKIQGTDHGTGAHYVTGPVYGQYALFVSQNVRYFPTIGRRQRLQTIIRMRYK